MRNKLSALKNHVSAHRGTYGLCVGIIAGAKIAQYAGEWNTFLQDEGVYDAIKDAAETTAE